MLLARYPCFSARGLATWTGFAGHQRDSVGHWRQPLRSQELKDCASHRITKACLKDPLVMKTSFLDLVLLFCHDLSCFFHPSCQVLKVERILTLRPLLQPYDSLRQSWILSIECTVLERDDLELLLFMSCSFQPCSCLRKDLCTKVAAL